MKYTLIFLALLSMIACAPKEKKPSFGPRGGVLHAVDCIEPIDNCYMEAIKLCPNGFNVNEAMEGPRVSFEEGFPLLVKGYSLQVECKR